MDPLVILAKKDFADIRKNKIFKKNKLIGTSSGILSTYVSSTQISRALKFWDLLIKDLKFAGFTIRHKQYYGTVAMKDGVELPLRLREKCKRVVRDDFPWSTSELEPIGKLIFTLNTIRKKEWEDSKTKPLELKIPVILKYLNERIQKEIVLRAEIKARNQEYEANKRAQEEMLLMKVIKKKKFNELMDECEMWYEANRLRKYIDTIKTNHSNNRFSTTLEKEEWLVWAYKMADEVDPLINTSQSH